MSRVRARVALALSGVAALLAAGAPAHGQALWYPLPQPPELEVSFGEGSAPCPEIPAAATQELLQCWADRVSRAAERSFQAQKGRGRAFACFPGGFVEKDAASLAGDPNALACTQRTSLCARPLLKSGQFYDEAKLDIGGSLRRLGELTRASAEQYTAFQYLRRGHSRNRFNPKLAALGIKQGLLALYLAQQSLHLERELLDASCGTSDGIRAHFDLARLVVEEVGESDLPTLLESYPLPGHDWERRLYELQLQLLSSRGPASRGGQWTRICAEVDGVDSSESELDGFDADLNAWCGYAYAEVGDAVSSDRHWSRARKSAFHPEAASYASWALRARKELAVGATP